MRINDREVADEDETECIHGLALDLPCTICSGKDVTPHHVAEELGLIIGAKYPGHCPACNLPIMEGQMIVHVTRYGGSWIHNDCFDT